MAGVGRGARYPGERFMWDYGMFPIWYPEAFPADLATALKAWSDEGSTRLASESRIEGSEWMAGWIDRGRSLAHEASRVLKRPVEYWNEATDERELITPPYGLTRRTPPSSTALKLSNYDSTLRTPESLNHS